MVNKILISKIKINRLIVKATPLIFLISAIELGFLFSFDILSKLIRLNISLNLLYLSVISFFKFFGVELGGDVGFAWAPVSFFKIINTLNRLFPSETLLFEQALGDEAQKK